MRPGTRPATAILTLAVVAVLTACHAPADPLPPMATDGAARYVATDGDDTGTGTQQAPYRTVAHGLSALRPGETLFIRGGTYRERITDVELRPGRSDALIQVRPYVGEQVTIQGLLWLRRPSYWSIEGLRVLWDDGNAADEHMVKITGGEHWSVTSIEAAGAKSYAGVLVVEDPDRPEHPAHWRLANSCVHDTAASNNRNQDHLVYVNTGIDSGPGVVEGNLLYGAPNGAGIKLGGPDPDDGGAARITARFNSIVETEQSIMLVWRSTKVRIERNLFVGTGRGYAAVRGFELAHGDNVVADNLAFDTAGMILSDEGYPDVQDGGDNRTGVDPQLVGEGCQGLAPTGDAARYGHLAAAGR
jgi:hypothetical protein